MTPGSVLSGALQAAVNQYLRLAEEPQAALALLDGRHVRLVLSIAPDIPAVIDIHGTANGLRIGPKEATDLTPDLCITGSPGALVRFAAQGSATDGVDIEGDARLAQAILKLFTEHAPDLEELVSRVTGDLAARQLGNIARGVLDFHRQTLARLMANTSEYVQYEAGDLAIRAEVDVFLDEVDTLRDDIERLDARLKRLAARRAASSGRPC